MSSGGVATHMVPNDLGHHRATDPDKQQNRGGRDAKHHDVALGLLEARPLVVLVAHLAVSISIPCSTMFVCQEHYCQEGLKIG